MCGWRTPRTRLCCARGLSGVAGGAGGNATSPPNIVGAGGVGIRIPATFHNPDSAPSDTSNPQPSQRGGGLGTPGPAGGFYVAGGGAGSTLKGAATGSFAGAPGGYGGGGSSADPLNPSIYGQPGVQNTGGGGGGSNSGPPSGVEGLNGGSGGSGIVLIAYPS